MSGEALIFWIIGMPLGALGVALLVWTEKP